jgi:hypothetical protein
LPKPEFSFDTTSPFLAKFGDRGMDGLVPELPTEPIGKKLGVLVLEMPS